MNLTGFLKSNDRNAWITELHIQIYVRKSMRSTGGPLVPCLDLANVNVTARFRSKGVFTAFLTRFEHEAKKINRIVLVECIQEHRLIHFLTNRGYSFMPDAYTVISDPSMYKTFI